MKNYKPLLLAFALMLVANHADYLLQAYQFSWPTWLELTARAPKWGLFDFIPHDAWHIVQTVRTTFSTLGAVLVGWWCAREYERLPIAFGMLCAGASAFILHGVARGIAFSLVRIIALGY